jgi:cytochrome c553
MKNLDIRLLMRATALAVVLVAPSAPAQSPAATYKTKCAGCHGVDGKGNTVTIVIRSVSKHSEHMILVPPK